MPVHVGEWPGYSRPSVASLQVVGERAYLAGGIQGFTIMDVSNPAKPVRLGGCETSGWAGSVRVAGNTAFIGINVAGYGIDIIDVSDPTNPFRIGRFDAAGGMDAVGNIFYLATGTLQIFDVTIPSAPLLLKQIDTGGAAFNVTVFGKLAFVSDSNRGIQIVDVSDPSNPKLAGSYKTGGWVADVAADRAYVTEGLKILDISNPMNPVLLGNSVTNTSRNLQNIALNGDIAYVARDVGGVEMVNVSNAANPVSVGSFSTNWFTADILVKESLAYVAKSDAGLEIFDVTDAVNPVLIGRDENAGACRDVTLAGQFVYLSDSGGGMKIIDVSDPANPAMVGSYKDAFAREVAVAGNLAFIADPDRGLQIVDVSNKAAPRQVGLYPDFTWPCVTASGNLAFFGGSEGITVLEVTNSAQPAVVSRFPFYPDTMTVQSNILFALQHSYLGAIDVSDPSALKVVGSVNLTGMAIPSDAVIVAQQNLLFVQTEQDFEVVNVSDVSNPIRIGGCKITRDSRDMSVAGNLAFVNGLSTKLEIIDITDPTNPVVIGKYPTGGFGMGVASGNGFVYVAEIPTGLQIFKIENVPVFEMRTVDGVKNFFLNGQIGREYEVEHLSSLGGTNWSAFRTISLTTNTAARIEGVSFEGAQEFYRARLRTE